MGKKNWYKANFSYFVAKIDFFTFFEKLQLKNAIKSNYQGGLGQEFKLFWFQLSQEQKLFRGKNLFHREYITQEASVIANAQHDIGKGDLTEDISFLKSVIIYLRSKASVANERKKVLFTCPDKMGTKLLLRLFNVIKQIE